ncbi:hypothetical protein NDU88_000761 [Pleurodeles waltl]|uniref:Uncharacterized protein n=1 Tax=Pleurodeles waltl TaxID=8319 RepID=A0AAV7RAZ0_PLEWA|nr:hypothetical protein NDU88_000761 [Pleurodeles waltl]
MHREAGLILVMCARLLRDTGVVWSELAPSVDGSVTGHVSRLCQVGSQLRKRSLAGGTSQTAQRWLRALEHLSDVLLEEKGGSFFQGGGGSWARHPDTSMEYQ